MFWAALLVGYVVMPDTAGWLLVMAVTGLAIMTAVTLGVGRLAAGRDRVRSWRRTVMQTIIAWVLFGVMFGCGLLCITAAIEYEWPVAAIIACAAVGVVALVVGIMLFIAVGPFADPVTPPANLPPGYRLARASVTAVGGSHRTFCVADFEYEGVAGGAQHASTLSSTWLFPAVSSGVMLCDSADRPIRFYDQTRA